MTAEMSAAVTADILITGSLLYFLKKSKMTGAHRLRYLSFRLRFRERFNNQLPLQDQLADQPVDVDGKNGASYRVRTSLGKCNLS